MRKVSQCIASLLLLSLLGTGCRTYRQQAGSMTSAWDTGRPAVAAAEFGSKADSKNHSGDSIIWHLEAGAAYRAAGNYAESDRHFDAAATKMDTYEQEAKVKVGHEAAAIFSNQQNLPYEGRPYDKIMLHTYKALNYLTLADFEKARPELIRAYQCQQDAVADNARRIAKAQDQENNAKDKAAIDRAKSDPTFNSALNNATKATENFKFYADYVNPFTVYLDGLFFMYQGGGGADLERANKSLKRVIEVAGANKFVQQDLDQSTAMINGAQPAPCTYVIFETGQAPSREQIRVDVPIIFSDVSYVGAAFPILVIHENEARRLTISGTGVQETAEPVANMDAIVALDFKNEYPTIVTKTLIATVTKAAAAWAVNEAARQQDPIGGLIARLGTAVAQASVNIADTRTWTTLPKEFAVARVNTPADRRLFLSAAGSPPMEVVVPPGSVNVIYARSVNMGTPLLVSQFKLK
jgi:uncharacterized protein